MGAGPGAGPGAGTGAGRGGVQAPVSLEHPAEPHFHPLPLPQSLSPGQIPCITVTFSGASKPLSQLAGSPSGSVAVGVTSSRDRQPQGAGHPAWLSAALAQSRCSAKYILMNEERKNK